ncbi:hypothetical protein K1T71_014914 [Dendrolimus kikuchii]|nr:hypothetical protein K1T71_014914 [Dendrolimus kikuchii]
MTSLIFGATSSPCVALYVKNKNAREFENEDREAARAIVVNHYMDDYLQSLQTVEEARKMTAAVDNIQRRAGFQLRGWTSNYKEAISSFAPSGQTTVEIGGSEIEKTLGLMWHVREDTLGFRVNQRRVPAEVLAGSRMPTKREALGLIMSIFDPLGFISPLTTPAKRIMQDTWKYKTTWDEVIPEELQDKWKNWLRDLISLPNLRIPRCYEYSPAAIRELHTFVDASEEAYAAVVYIRTTRADGRVNVMIAAAKSRVTPMKPVSIPRLELQAAVLGARLSKSVQEGHDWELHRHTYWSDSRTTLAWIRAEPRTYKTFVAHRLAEIEDLTKKNEWRWLPSAQNVADDATRKTPSDFNPQHRWFTGPKFLYLDIEKWPQETKTEVPTTGEEKCATLTEDNDVIVIDFKPPSHHAEPATPGAELPHAGPRELRGQRQAMDELRMWVIIGFMTSRMGTIMPRLIPSLPTAFEDIDLIAILTSHSDKGLRIKFGCKGILLSYHLSGSPSGLRALPLTFLAVHQRHATAPPYSVLFGFSFFSGFIRTRIWPGFAVALLFCICLGAGFGHVERMHDERMTKQIYNAKLDGFRSPETLRCI